MSTFGEDRSGCDEARRGRAIESFRAYLLVMARRSLGGSPLGAATASDVVQEALLAATLADREGRGPGPTDRDLRLWLSAILENKIREAARREAAKKRGGGRPTAPLPQDCAGEGTSPSHGAIRREEEVRLEEAMRTLSAEDRRLVAWSIQEGLGRREIGERLGVSASYASRICDRAEVRLRDAFRATRRGDADER